MENFSISAYLIGLLKGLPTMVLSLGMVWCLVRWEELLTARNVHRILRILVLSICGFAGAWVISTVTWTPYDGKIHPMVTMCIMPFMFYAYIQCYRYEQRRKGLREGNPSVNRNWLIAGCVVWLGILGLYPMDCGMDAHAFFVIGVWVPYFAIAQYLIFFANDDGCDMWASRTVKGGVEYVLILAIYFAVAYLCWMQIHQWEGFPNF